MKLHGLFGGKRTKMKCETVTILKEKVFHVIPNFVCLYFYYQTFFSSGSTKSTGFVAIKLTALGRPQFLVNLFYCHRPDIRNIEMVQTLYVKPSRNSNNNSLLFNISSQRIENTIMKLRMY